MSSNRASPLLPVLALLLGAGLWGVIWYPMRLLEWRGLSGLWLTLILYVAALAVSLPYTGRHLPQLVREWRLTLPLALAGGWTNTAFVLAILDGNVMRVLLLFYLSPMWAVLLGRLLLGERISLASLLTLVAALAGAVLLLWEPTEGMPWPRGTADWLALSSGFAFALSNVLVRKHQTASLAIKSVSVWVGVVALCVGLIALFPLPLPSVAPAVIAWAAALGVFGILVMTVLVQYGVTHLPVQRSAVILLFELVTGAISQQLFTEEAMTPLGWAGGALVIVAAYWSARHSGR